MRVIVAEDSVLLREGVVRLLEEASIEVVGQAGDAEELLRMDPAQAARIIADGVEKGRGRILVGQDAKVVDAFVRLLPSRYPRLAVAVEGRLAR